MHFRQTVALIFVALTVSSCGTHYTGANALQVSQNSTSTSSLTGMLVPTSVSSGSGSTASTGTAAPITLPVTGSGYTSVVLTVSAGQVLKMKFTPTVQPSLPYSQLGIFVTVGTKTLNTAMLATGLLGGVAQTSATMDFSSAIASSCSTADCRQNVTILISKPNYDYWCLTTGTNCPYNRMSAGHPWGGMMLIQTDDTQSI